MNNKPSEEITGKLCRTPNGKRYHKVYFQLKSSGVPGYTRSKCGLLDSTDWIIYIFDESDTDKFQGLTPCKRCYNIPSTPKSQGNGLEWSKKRYEERITTRNTAYKAD